MRAGRLGWLMLLFALMLVVGLAWGTATGGDTYVAFWESRALFYAVICFFLAANTIRTRGHVRTLMGLTLLSTGAFAIEGAYRKIALLSPGELDVAQEFAFAHDSSIFLAVVILLVLAQAVFGAPRWQRLLGLGLLPIALFTLFASQRRAGIMGLLIAFLALAMVMAITRRKAFFLLIVPLLFSLAVYLPLFWNNTGTIGLAPYHDWDSKVPADVKTKVADATTGITNGTIKTCVSPAKGAPAPEGCGAAMGTTPTP